eukprot:UN04541
MTKSIFQDLAHIFLSFLWFDRLFASDPFSIKMMRFRRYIIRQFSLTYSTTHNLYLISVIQCIIKLRSHGLLKIMHAKNVSE